MWVVEEEGRVALMNEVSVEFPPLTSVALGCFLTFGLRCLSPPCMSEAEPSATEDESARAANKVGMGLREDGGASMREG